MLTPRKIEIECTLSPIIALSQKKEKKNVFNRTGGVLNFPRYFFSPFFHQKSPFPDFQFHRYRTNNEYRRLITPKKKKKKGEKRKRKKEIGDKITKRFARADFTERTFGPVIGNARGGGVASHNAQRRCRKGRVGKDERGRP